MSSKRVIKLFSYILLSILIILFITSIILPQKFDYIISKSNIFLNSIFELSGWYITIGSLLSFFGIVFLIQFFNSILREELIFHSYKTDIIKKIKWKWNWEHTQIEKLWCFCPTCNRELSYQSDHLLFKTNFFCQNCEKQVQSIDGDNINYVLSAIKAEIRRKAQKNHFNQKS